MKTIIRIQDYVVHLPHFRFLKWGRQEGIEQRRMVAYLDSRQARLASPSGMISLQELRLTRKKNWARWHRPRAQRSGGEGRSEVNYEDTLTPRFAVSQNGRAGYVPRRSTRCLPCVFQGGCSLKRGKSWTRCYRVF